MLARRPIYLTVLALATSLVLLPSSSASAATPSCGTQAQKPSGGYRTCTFADDFNGTALNRSKWGALTTAATGFTVAGECDVDDSAHIGVANGLLTLTATRL